jgi:putative transcriptional regulator
LWQIRDGNRLLALVLVAALSQAQELAVGKLLAASRKSVDPDFSKTVVLLVHYDEQGAIGLLVNRPSNVPISEVFPALKTSPALFYAGGPISIGVRALLRSRSKPGQAVHIFGDVSVISNKPLLEKLIGAGTPSSSFRVYAGYTGWSAQQLRNEVALGLWLVLPGDAGVVFDPNPEKVWGRLVNHAK